MDNVLPFRLLCQINENLHHTVADLRSLCAGISVPGDRLDRMVIMIEESRAVWGSVVFLFLTHPLCGLVDRRSASLVLSNVQLHLVLSN